MSAYAKQKSRSPAARLQAGLTLTELLVSLALSATLMAGLTKVLYALRVSDRSQEGNSRMQEAGQFAITFLGEDIRMAGYLGCSSTLNTAQINSMLVAPPASFQPMQGIQGWEANNTDPGTINNHAANVAVTSTSTGWGTTGGNVLENINVLPGTDIIRVWGGGDSLTTPGFAQEGTINSITPPPLFNVINTSVMDVSAGDILLLSDCEQADIVQACTVTGVGGPPITSQNIGLTNTCSPGNTATPLQTLPGGSVNILSGNLYYIGKRGDIATNPPSLFRRSLGSNGGLGSAVELIEGVANMQILYGENNNNDAENSVDSFVPADQVSDWSDVVAVRISFLVQSIEDNLGQSPLAYSYNGVTYDGAGLNGELPADNRLRRVFSTTIGIRNRVL